MEVLAYRRPALEPRLVREAHAIRRPLARVVVGVEAVEMMAVAAVVVVLPVDDQDEAEVEAEDENDDDPDVLNPPPPCHGPRPVLPNKPPHLAP